MRKRIHKLKTSKIPSTKRALLTSFFVDLLDILINTTVAIITGSIVMLAEMLQGMADLTADTLLLIGFRRSKKSATRMHPFGFGKEAYFWSLLAAVVILVFTASLSFYSGLQRFLSPEEDIGLLWLAYATLIVSVGTNGYSLSVNTRKLLEGRSLRSLPRAFMNTIHVAPRTAFVLDSVGFTAAILGLTALIVFGITDDIRFDGVGAMAIGVLLAIASIVLLSSARAFIAGRRAPAQTERLIKDAALLTPGVSAVLDLRTMLLGHKGLLVNIEIHFEDDMITDEIEKTVDEIKRNINRAVEGRVYIQVEPETPRKTQNSKSA